MVLFLNPNDAKIAGLVQKLEKEIYQLEKKIKQTLKPLFKKPLMNDIFCDVNVLTQTQNTGEVNVKNSLKHR